MIAQQLSESRNFEQTFIDILSNIYNQIYKV
jgi:hypothetical protein